MPEMSGVAKAFCTSRPYRAFARRVVLPWALQGLRLKGEALEIGTGSGAMTSELLTMFPDLRVVATDYDPEMVLAAQRTLAPFGQRARVQRVDAAQLPFADGCFDAVLSFVMLHHVVTWEQAVAEAIRVLRPGGQLVGYDLVDVSPSRVIHCPEGRDARLMRRGQLEDVLRDLPVRDVLTRRSLGLLLRFCATKDSIQRARSS